MASRAFLLYLSKHAPSMPMYTFVDLDPDGIAIMSTYKYGSYRLAHENFAAGQTAGLTLPNMRWLGLKKHHISSGSVYESNTAAGYAPDLQGLMRLTARDRTKAVRMLEWDLCCEAGPEQEWRHELQGMLMLNIKAEMQILDECPGGMISFLHNELGQVHDTEEDTVSAVTCMEEGLLF